MCFEPEAKEAGMSFLLWAAYLFIALVVACEIVLFLLGMHGFMRHSSLLRLPNFHQNPHRVKAL